jgi:hypothetical protein
MCFSGYITSDNSVASKSGMYFTELSGCTISLLDNLTKEDHADYRECFDYLYKAAQRNLKIDVQKKLANRFHIDKKLITRETSEFKDDFNTGSALAGVKISVTLPKYARLNIISIGLVSENEHESPEAEFYIYKDDAEGDLLSTVSAAIVEGKNTIEVYQEFEEDTIFIGYDPSVLSLKKTRTLYYPIDNGINGWGDLACTFPCWYGGDGEVYQINQGGLNIKFILYCSMEKVLCENLPLFENALLYKLGIETMKERITSQKVNKTTVLTAERAAELLKVFTDDYMEALEAATMNIKMTEDPICFSCKRTISSKTVLP